MDATATPLKENDIDEIWSRSLKFRLVVNRDGGNPQMVTLTAPASLAGFAFGSPGCVPVKSER